MLVTKREVKQTSKKLLSVLLAVIMMMSSMSVCFGTFVASAADVDHMQNLADKLKDSAYSTTLSLLAAGKDSGSGVSRKVNISFGSYTNYKQAAELLRLLDSAARTTDAWNVASQGGSDQQSACTGKTTQDLYNELIKSLAKKQVNTDDGTDVQKFLRLVYTWDGAVLHSGAVKSKSQSAWSNTVTFSTTDIKGYLAQVGKAANVASSVELGVQYVVKMQGDLYYGVAGSCGSTTKYYHHMLWFTETPVSAPATSSSNTEAYTKVQNHINELNSFINLTYDQLLAKANDGTLDSTIADYNSKKAAAVTYVGSDATYASLFADYTNGINNFLTSAQSAKDFQKYMPTVNNWNDFVAANPDYGTFQYPNFGAKGSATQVKLIEDFATFKSYYDYLVSGGDIYTYLIDNNYIDETYYKNFYDNVVAYDLQDSKDAADALYLQYSVSPPAIDIVLPTVEEKTIVYSQLCGYINAIGAYSSQVVNAVYTDGYAYLVEFREALKCDINPAVLYFAENADKSFVDLSTTALWDKINEARGKSGEVNALYEEVKSIIGQTKADTLLQASKNAATKMIEGLYQTLAARFTTEVNNAWDVYVALGKPTSLKVDTFLQLSAVMVAIEPSILTDLQAAGKAGYITQTTIDRYNELMKVGGIYEIWNAYASTYGFPDYKQTQLIYADRQPMEGDELKTSADPVTEAEMNKLITALDTIITSDLVGDLLGGLLNPDAEEGAEFNLGTMLTDLIKGVLFTDDFINTVVQLLYPLVLGEFNKVWATLPTSIEYSGMDVTVRYKKSLNNILDEGNFEIYPDLLAQKLIDLGYSTKYAENIANLQAAGGEADSWESPKLVDYDTGKLMLSWGVTEQKEKLDAGEITQAEFDAFFYQAFEDATAGLLPLLTTLITNKAWTPAECTYIATGQVTVLFAPVTLNVALQLGSTANHGYANLLVPIYELLGVPYTPVSTIESSAHNSDVAYVLEQILAPVFTFLEKLGEKPVDTLLEVLPDLVYALAFRMAKPLLNMLNTTITYSASANIVGEVLADGALIEVGNMLITDEEDALLPNSMFAGGLNTILAHFGLNIPAIDQATLATLGKLETMSTGRLASVYSGLSSGQAYTIKADKADVGYYLLSYILNIVKDEASLRQLLSLFMTQKDENGEVIKDADDKAIPDTEAIDKLINETLYNDEGLNLDEINVGNVIAAIVELANQVEYGVDGYSWYAGEYSSPAGSSVAMDIYLNPNNDWTKEKAEYLYNNLDSLVASILTMAKVDLDAETEGVQNNLGELLADLLGGLLGDKTLTSLAGLLASLDLNTLLAPKDEAAEGEETEEEAGLNLADILNDLLVNELGIDLSVYTAETSVYTQIAAALEADPEYVHDFGVDSGNKTFAEVLAEMLAPAKPLLDFILGGKDITLIDSAITLHGYKGYDNALIPLLEALGAAPVAYTDGADTLKLTVDALVARIEALTTGDVIKNIIDLLPGVVYYLSSNALSQGVDKLLTPVYAILDTIRPIYNVDLNKLLAGIEIGEEGNKKPLGLDLKNLNWSFIFGLLNNLVGLDLSALTQVIYDVAKSIGVEYKSVSTLQSTWKKGAYSEDFDQADMLTVVLSFILEWATVEDNAAKLDELLKTEGIIASLKDVFADVEITYDREPNWYYWFDTEEAFETYLEGNTNIPNTLASLDWENIGDNDWDKETAQYFAENIDELVDIIIAMINKDKVDENGNALPTNLSDLLSNLVNGLVNAETLNSLVALIADLLKDVDDNLLEVAGVLLSDGEGDKIDIVGLKNYKYEGEITSINAFINELANVLDTYASGLINWLFFGDDFRFAKLSDGKTDTIVINGGLGYEKGLAMILEALGCELPAEANTKSVLGALVIRVEEILDNPIEEVLDLLPNLVYFLNANGAGVALDNILKPVNALLDKLSAFGLNVNLADLLKIKKDDGTEIAIDLANLSLENVVTIVEGATGLPLDAAEAILVDFCTGKITKGEYIYKMEAAREDVITILLVVALELISDDAFAAKLNEMLNTDIITGIKAIFNGSEIIYKNPDWNYMYGIETEDGVIEYVNAITSYPNDWTEEKAEYLAENLPALVDTVITMVEIGGVKYESLSALLEANVNIFTTETLNSLLDLIKNLLGNIDAKLLEVGYIIDVDLPGLMKYEVPAGIETVDAFADELATILTTYAKGAVEWLLLGRDFKLLVKDADGIEEGLETDGSYITISGAQGYAEGLALLLEALGCENLPEVYDENGEALELDTAATVKAVLTALAARIEVIFANPVKEVVDLLPNLIYFLDADGIDAVITNTTAALTALVAKLEVFGIKLDINSLVNLPELMGIADKYAEGDNVIALDNLTLTALLKALSLMTELDFTELENVLVPFALGEAKKYDSVSASKAYKMVYADEYDKHDMISVIVSAALRMFVENDANAKKLDEMIGTEIISALKDVFADVEITYTAPEWDYALTGDGEYMLTYPNNWNEATAEYVASILPGLGDMIAGLIDSNYATLSDLLKDKVNVFTTDNLQAIVDLIANLLKDIDDGLLDAAGVLLGADVVGLKAYKAPAGITTADAFAAELANVLNTYAKGVVEWLLLGKDYKFFVKEVENGAPVDFININGAKGYSEGLALLLEALGCENLPEATGNTEEIVSGVLTSVAALINKLLDKPVETVAELLPNLLYFLNTNGVAAVVDNTLAAVTALLDKLEAFGVNVNINELVNLKKLMGIEDTDAAISLDDLSMAAVLEAVGLMVGLDLTVIESVLVGFDLGSIAAYDTVSTAELVGTAKKMSYSESFEVKDMVTVLVNLVVLTIADEENAQFVKDLLGEKAYAIVENLVVNGVVPADIQPFDWQFTEKADTDEVFSAMITSEEYKNHKYGPLYTEEMANYIADNFGTFVNNIIYLLGIEINGKNVDDLTDLINGLLNGSLYNSENVIAIRDALAGVLAGIKDLEVNGANVGKYIVEVLKTAEIADVEAVANVEVPEFTENREMFVQYLCDVLEPLYPVLRWVLSDEDIAFFVEKDGDSIKDAVKLEGGEGYAYGIIPLLEVLECKDILAPEAYYAAVEADGDVVITSILNPLLNRVDEILAVDPAQVILDMLPNLIYFINSNGLDTVVKNTLHAVYGLLSAIKPIAEIDLYELIGIDLAEIDFNWLLEKLLDVLADAGYDFDLVEISAISELTVGKLVSYESLNGELAYKMVYAEGESGNKAEMVTVVLRLLVTFLMHEKNAEVVLDLLQDKLGMSDDARKYMAGVFEAIAAVPTETYLGMDQALAVIYYIYYGADLGVGELAGGVKDINAEWKKILKELSASDDPSEITIGDFLNGFLNTYFEDIFTSEGIAPNGFIAFFQRIADWFNKIIEWFKNLFN